MSKKLWGGRFTKAESKSATEFNASIDFDQKMYRQDIAGSRAHAAMLAKQGIISQADAEAIDAGTARLVGTDYRNIVSGVSELLDDNVAYLRMSKAANPYGDGQSVSRIIEIMQQNL